MKPVVARFVSVVVLSAAVFQSVAADISLGSRFSPLEKLKGVVESSESLKKTTDGFAKAVEDITPENEYYIGRSVAATILTNYKTYTNPSLEQYLNEICQTLVLNSGMPEIYNGYHVKLLDSSEVNAFATSGGHIFVTRGLVACTASEDALASVLAHEIGHIQLKHGLKAIKSSRFADASRQAVSTISSAAGLSGPAQALDGMTGDIVNQMMECGYSKTQEYEADSFAASLLFTSGYNPYGIVDMLTALDKKQEGKTTGFYKTHPAPKSRITKLDAQLRTYHHCSSSEIRNQRFNKVLGR